MLNIEHVIKLVAKQSFPARYGIRSSSRWRSLKRQLMMGFAVLLFDRWRRGR